MLCSNIARSVLLWRTKALEDKSTLILSQAAMERIYNENYYSFITKA
jgi:hypothetical protein